MCGILRELKTKLLHSVSTVAISSSAEFGVAVRMWIDPDNGDLSACPIWVGESFVGGVARPIRLMGGPGNTPLYTDLA